MPKVHLTCGRDLPIAWSRAGAGTWKDRDGPWAPPCRLEIPVIFGIQTGDRRGNSGVWELRSRDTASGGPGTRFRA